jgi:hypothetical protein
MKFDHLIVLLQGYALILTGVYFAFKNNPAGLDFILTGIIVNCIYGMNKDNKHKDNA